MSHKGTTDHINFMRIEIVSELVDRLKAAQLEALMDEHLISEIMVKLRDNLIDDSRGLKTYQSRLWVPLFGGTKFCIVLTEIGD